MSAQIQKQIHEHFHDESVYEKLVRVLRRCRNNSYLLFLVYVIYF